MSKTIAIIPARYSSSRFPGKPLALITGKTMIERVYERTIQAKKIDEVIVATEDQRIIDCVLSFGGNAVLTSDKHNSGTDRVFEASKGFNADYILNIQGDEPLVSPNLIDSLAEAIQNSDFDCATPIIRIYNLTEYLNPNFVKVTKSITGKALYFSRSPIPYVRGNSFDVGNFDCEKFFIENNFYSHIGLYAYKYKSLEKFSLLPESNYEHYEALEQLRMLENGMNLLCVETTHKACAVDVPSDVSKTEEIMKKMGIK
ncbi:MAG: 3-deoxy-manno-octulosonate cytidylyltransferase [Chlorobiota bacterium]|jgi:3-deoxy-manno-octulosonate cytidylyltransferase (CMP-KDO synthetase)|nr:3-deoxy-manno-octulosonate cytidylyltransferase [Chlorobiota bacterium]QQS66967.1 MAG: 3-deoxy-manno-octulosonate cytidylyltransferase [Chlorobiota bacterium]